MGAEALGWLAAAGGATSLGLIITLAIILIRGDGLKTEAAKSKARADKAHDDREVAEERLVTMSAGFSDYRTRAEEIQQELSEELEFYEDRELKSIKDEPDTVVRIKRRRRLVGSVLSDLSRKTDAPSDDGDAGMRDDTSS